MQGELFNFICASFFACVLYKYSSVVILFQVHNTHNVNWVPCSNIMCDEEENGVPVKENDKKENN